MLRAYNLRKPPNCLDSFTDQQFIQCKRKTAKAPVQVTDTKRMTGNEQQDRARAEVTFIGKTCWRSSYGVLLEKNMESQKRTRQLHVKKYIIKLTCMM